MKISLISPHAMPATNPSQHRDPELWQAARQFETLLWHQMVTAMRKTVPESGLLPSGFSEDVYTSMFNEALSKVASNHTTLGLAEHIYRQFSGENGVRKEEAITKDFRRVADKYPSGHIERSRDAN